RIAAGSGEYAIGRKRIEVERFRSPGAGPIVSHDLVDTAVPKRTRLRRVSQDVLEVAARLQELPRQAEKALRALVGEQDVQVTVEGKEPVIGVQDERVQHLRGLGKFLVLPFPAADVTEADDIAVVALRPARA